MEPGRTGQITIGGNGRPVVGRVVLPDGQKPFKGANYFAISVASDQGPVAANEVFASWEKMSRELMVQLPPLMAGVAVPPEGVSPEEWREKEAHKRLELARQLSDLYDRWRTTDDAKAAFEQMSRSMARRNVPIEVQADGSFRIDDVPPGRYALRPHPSSDWESGRPDPQTGRFVITARHRAPDIKVFTVPPVKAGQVDEPLDIGEIRIPPFEELKLPPLAK